MSEKRWMRNQGLSWFFLQKSWLMTEKYFMKRLLLFALIIFSVPAVAQQDFAMIVTAPHSDADNYPNFDHNALKAYRSYGLSGINRDKVAILTGDGKNPFAHNSLIDLPQLTSGIPAAHQHADGQANKMNIKAKFLEMAAKMKPGDHFHLFITGHGHRKDGKVTIQLWGNETISVEELRSYLKLLPAGVTKHILGSYCFSGSLMPLTSEPNTCAFSAVDEKTQMKAFMTYPDAQGKQKADDTYTDVMFDTLLKGTAFYDSQKNADKLDAKNNSSMNSLDWYLETNKPNQGYNCDKIPDNKVNELLRYSLLTVAKTKPAPQAYSDYVKSFKQYKDAIAQMTIQYDKLTPAQQKIKRGEFTLLLEEIKQNLNLAAIQNKPMYVKAMAREQEFIEKATPTQMKKYLQIKACVNYAIK
jgi:hypothetical protein